MQEHRWYNRDDKLPPQNTTVELYVNYEVDEYYHKCRRETIRGKVVYFDNKRYWKVEAGDWIEEGFYIDEDFISLEWRVIDDTNE